MENRILNNRYKLEAEIGRGGMGVVYRAIDTQLNRTVAIKVLPPEFVHNTQFLVRFNSEIRNTSQLEHQNIVSVYDIGVDDNTNYYVMRYVDGQDLKAYLAKHGRLSVTETCRILGHIADALDYAHARGIVHRDIKPENILIDCQGVPSLTDFGIARSMEGTRMTAGMVGTPEYMSPEQAKGEDVNGSSDQYSLAIVAYEMLTGITPFHSSIGQPWAMVTKHINETPADPRTIVPDLASNVAEAVMKALAKTVEQRYLNCVKFVEELQQAKIIAEVTIANDKEKVAMPAKKPSFIIPLVLACILCLSGAIFLFAGGDKNKVPISDKNKTRSTTVVTPSKTVSSSNNKNTRPPKVVTPKKTVSSRNNETTRTPTVVIPSMDISSVTLKTNPKDGAMMVYIPAGEFLMGSTDADESASYDEKSQRRVYLDGYYMYVTEVTVAQYRKFCTSTHRLMPHTPPWGWQATHPIVSVSWDDAKAYTDWAGTTLPTEAQWEKAARGSDGGIYPWGNEWDAAKCVNYKNSNGGTKPVGSILAGASPYGCMDMAGNVWEWCADWYGSDYYNTAPTQNPTGPETGNFRVLRGGSWGINGSGYIRCSYRGGNNPSNFIYGVGFRCAVSSQEP